MSNITVIAGISDPVLEEFITNKMNMLCEALATFFNYMITSRPDAIPVVIREKSQNSTGQNYVANGDDGGTNGISPFISMGHIRYLIEDIFPCNTMLEQENSIYFGQIPDKIKFKMKKMLESHLSKKVSQLKNARGEIVSWPGQAASPIPIDPSVYQAFWTYIVNSVLVVKNIMAVSQSLEPIDPNKGKHYMNVSEAISYLENLSLTKRYGSVYLGDTTLDTALNSLLRVIVSLIEWWLDDNQVLFIGENDVMAAYDIIIPRSLQKSLVSKDDKNKELAISQALREIDAGFSPEALKLIVAIIQQVEETILKKDLANDDKKFLSRIVSFCGPL